MSGIYCYLASPYSSDDKDLQQLRYMAAVRACAFLAQTGLPVYSPIVHWHKVAQSHRLPTDAQFWRTQNETFMLHADHLKVLQLAGWQESIGVTEEIAWARSHNIPVLMFPPVA